MLRRVLISLCLAFTLAACEEDPLETTGPTNLRENVPPTGPTVSGEICTLVRNRAPFTVTGQILLKSRERATFRIPKGVTEKLCLVGESYGNGAVSPTLTNFVTIPVFHCYTLTDQVVDVFAYRQQEGWLYNVSCR